MFSSPLTNVAPGVTIIVRQSTETPSAGIVVQPAKSFPGRSSAWLEHLVWDQGVEGSNPFAPIGRYARHVDQVHRCRHATRRYEILKDGGSFQVEIPPRRGVYTCTLTLEGCRSALTDALEDWLLFRIHKHLPLPKIDGIE